MKNWHSRKNVKFMRRKQKRKWEKMDQMWNMSWKGKRLLSSLHNQRERITPSWLYQAQNFKDKLVSIDETDKSGSGTFGRCLTAMYHNQYCVSSERNGSLRFVKERNWTGKTISCSQASELADLKDHPGMHHLFGMWSGRACSWGPQC